LVRLVEGLANLGLSIVLLRRYGVIGVAIGTLIPQLCSNLLFLPGHLCRVLGVRVRTYIRQAYLAPLLLCAPLIAVLLWLRAVFPARNYRELFVQTVVGALVYGIGLTWFLLTQEQMGRQLRARFRQSWRQAVRPASLL